MAKHKASILPTEVHSVAFAERESLAGLAGFRLPHPTAVTVRLKSVFPNGPERVFVDIALVVFSPDGGAGRYRTVDENRGNGDTGGALVEMIPYTPFVVAQIAFARIAHMPTRFPFAHDIVH